MIAESTVSAKRVLVCADSKSNGGTCRGCAQQTEGASAGWRGAPSLRLVVHPVTGCVEVLAREREALAVPRRAGGDHEVTVLGQADSLDDALAVLVAQDGLAGRRRRVALVEVETVRAGPAGHLRRADGLNDRALVDPIGEAVERRGLGTTPLAAALGLGIEGLVGVDLLGEGLADRAILARAGAGALGAARRSRIRAGGAVVGAPPGAIARLTGPRRTRAAAASLVGSCHHFFSKLNSRFLP